MTDTANLTEHGRAVLQRFKIKYGLPLDASLQDCLTAYRHYDEARINSLNAEESKLMFSLFVRDFKRATEGDHWDTALNAAEGGDA